MVCLSYRQKVYKGRLHPWSSNKSKDETPDDFVLLKFRFHKHYRHPTLDGSLIKSRIAGEARAIVKCQRYVIFPIERC